MKIDMGKRKLSLSITIISIVILSSLAILHLFEPLPLIYYTYFSSSTRELPTKFIRRAFRLKACHKLPSKTDGLRALWMGGRDSSIFVRFGTDADGVEYILKTFGGPSAKYEKLDFNKLKIIEIRGLEGSFPIVAYEQEKMGINILDSGPIESGFLLESGWQPSPKPVYTILIDDQKNKVYIFVMTT